MGPIVPRRLGYVDEATRMDLVWGPYRRIPLTHATDPEVRFRSSNGGVLTALGQYLVTSGDVDFVLHAKATKSHPTFGERHLSADAAAGVLITRS